jgi:uncharacterized protein (DUF934 family)
MADILVTDSGFAPYQSPASTSLLAIEEASEEQLARLLNGPEVHIPFATAADGRGFSYARRLRELGYQGRIFAVGALVCDQYRHARQSGCDGVLISAAQAQKMPENHWLEQARRVTLSYRSQLYE